MLDVKGFGNLNHFCIALDKAAWDALVSRLEQSNVDIENGPVIIRPAGLAGRTIKVRW